MNAMLGWTEVNVRSRNSRYSIREEKKIIVFKKLWFMGREVLVTKIIKEQALWVPILHYYQRWVVNLSHYKLEILAYNSPCRRT